MEAAKRTRLPRAFTDIKLEVRGAAGTYGASARDLGVGGLRIRGPLKAAVDERIGLTLLLPTPHRVTIMALVRWVKEEGPTLYVLGAKFLHTAESLKKMQQLMQEVQSGKLGVTRPAGGTRRIPKL
jgi:hypothetical protein